MKHKTSLVIGAFSGAVSLIASRDPAVAMTVAAATAFVSAYVPTRELSDEDCMDVILEAAVTKTIDGLMAAVVVSTVGVTTHWGAQAVRDLAPVQTGQTQFISPNP